MQILSVFVKKNVCLCTLVLQPDFGRSLYHQALLAILTVQGFLIFHSLQFEWIGFHFSVLKPFQADLPCILLFHPSRVWSHVHWVTIYWEHMPWMLACAPAWARGRVCCYPVRV